MTTNFIIAFIGLPSSGKSSIINSLILKRILQSGVCRTTIEVNKSIPEIVDDNKNKFIVIDLPGICDSEEVNNSDFTKLTYDYIIEANLIIWTSDVNKAFLTTHECNEFNKLKLFIKTETEKTGKLYYLIILLSKCDFDTSNNNNFNNEEVLSDEDNDELNNDEDTNIIDLINKVKDKFPNEDIILYNAYGRSFHHKKTSKKLQSFVKQQLQGCEPTKHNITFDISKYCKNYSNNQKDLYYKQFIHAYNLYIESKLLFTKLYDKFINITFDEQIEHLNKTWINQYFKDNKAIIKDLAKDIDKNIDINIDDDTFANIIIKNHDKIINSNKEYIKHYNPNQHLMSYIHMFLLYNFSNIFYFEELNNIYILKKLKADILEYFLIIIIININTILIPTIQNLPILSNNKISCNSITDIGITIEFLLKFIKDNILIENILTQLYSIKNINDKPIKLLDILVYHKENIKIIFNRIILEDEITIINNMITVIKSNEELLFNQNIKNSISQYVEFLIYLNSDTNEGYLYILLNKLQIIKNIKTKTKINSLFHDELERKDLSFSLFRIRCNPKYEEIINSIWKKIYSSEHIEYIDDYTNFIPINETELLYK